MDKENFLLQLEKLLYNIPAEEREEALEYYRSYFEDAGEENEAMVLEELGSAQEIALSIKEGLSEGASREEYLKYPPQLRNKKEQSKAGPVARMQEITAVIMKRGHLPVSQAHLPARNISSMGIMRNMKAKIKPRNGFC